MREISNNTTNTETPTKTRRASLQLPRKLDKTENVCRLGRVRENPQREKASIEI